MVSNLLVPKPPKSVTPDQLGLATRLLEISGLGNTLKLVRNERTGYIVLESRNGSNIRNKNVVSILRSGVQFQISDWTDEIEAADLGFATKRVEKLRHLKFKNLKLGQVVSQEAFFTGMCAKAFRGAKRRQGN